MDQDSNKHDLRNKVIVITGASSGFGKGAAIEFARRGASLVLAARRDQLLDAVAQECQTAGGRAIAAPTDVSDPADVEHLSQTALASFGRIDVWVNNAGAGALGRFEEIPLAEHVQVIDTNLLGTLYGSYYAMQEFRKHDAGILINIASVVGKVPAPYFSSYVASKNGVIGLSAALRLELKENNLKNIHVCTVLPTSTDTPFFQHEANYMGRQAQPTPPVYKPEEVVEAIVRLATEPEDEVSIGGAGKFMIFAHNLAPGLAENMMGRRVHKHLTEEAPPAKDTSGNLMEPTPVGSSVSGGWKK